MEKEDCEILDLKEKNDKLSFDQLFSLQTLGLDYLSIKDDHFKIYKYLKDNNLLTFERFSSTHIKFPSNICSEVYQLLFKNNFHSNTDLINKFNLHYYELKSKLSINNIEWVFTDNFDKKVVNLKQSIPLSDSEVNKIKEIFFNYYVSTCYEEYARTIEFPEYLVSLLKERIFRTRDIIQSLNEIIDQNSFNDHFSQENYVFFDTILKKARKSIHNDLLGYISKSNDYDLDPYEKQILRLKSIEYSLCFKNGVEEKIAMNQLIFELYKLYSSRNGIYLPHVTATLNWFNSNFDFNTSFKINYFTQVSLRKKINDLKKSEMNPEFKYNKNLEQILNSLIDNIN